ncbi:MAG: isoprenylcysteine carboxylmethyltransferase family protein [Thiothrix sp.]|nr:isoprenylcysteine carboxylmethyltransferase family protein [Thiothrix sp.]HPQ94387.1 isoprenylcysteine carboxylmethyltransferase family protein [Thiolinea sp.]
MLKTLIPPPVYALVAAALMWGLDRWLPLLHWLPEPWNRVGLVLIGLAALADLWSLGLFFRARTTPNPMRPHRASALVTGGLYRYSRNPMYLGMLVMLGSLTPGLVLPLFVRLINRVQILPEEAVLAGRFGAAYRDYCRQVRRWF